MKKKLLPFLAATFIVATLIFCFFGWLAQKATENGAILLFYYGGLLTILYIAGVTFRRAYVWEIRVGRMVQHMTGPVSTGYLFSSLIMKIFAWLMLVLIVTATLSINDHYDNWLATIWEPLKIVSGWPSFFSSLMILFILLISYFIRDEYCYRPKSEAKEK